MRPVSWVAGLVLAGLSSSLAQTNTNNFVPVVTIQATQPVATTNHPGVFTVYRAGNTDATLNVWYDLGGTASNGVDYALIPPHLVAIAAGATSNTIIIAPTSNPPGAIFSKTVVLTLTNSPLMTPVNYEIGSPSRATVWINTYFPPLAIVKPKDGTVFYTPMNLQMVAGNSSAFVPTNVEFFAGTNDLGEGVPGVTIQEFPGWGGVWFLSWSNAPVGAYVLTAIGRDNTGVSVTSAPANITVLQGPPTNLPPAVTIFAPPNGVTFYTPTNVQILAKASDQDGFVTNVEFFAGTNDLGPGSAIVLDPPGVNGFTGLVYWFNWVNPSPGGYPLTAVATDNGGASTTSAPVDIAVLSGPPTNLPPVVRIISPPNAAVFRAPVNVPLYAYAAAPDGSVASVEFFVGGSSLGFGQPVRAAPPPLPPGEVQPPILIVVPTNYWELLWTNPPPGTNIVLTAEATDDAGAATISPPVEISILPSLPPPTNRPPLVRIVATDPVAIEGTNCWPWLGLADATPTWSNWLAGGSTYRLNTNFNCGPKNATFTLFRHGATNDDLNVNYLIGGTATNGVDYVTLPGTVTIPAGERQAAVSIVPLDDGPPDLNRTVVLKLAPGTNYLRGFPSAAAAIILDSRFPCAATGMLPGRVFHLNAAGPDGAWFGVEYSTDMIHWTPVCTNQVVNGAIDFLDPDAASQPARFYRTVPVNGPPQ